VVIEDILKGVQAGYVYPDKAAEMNRAVRARLARGEYDALPDEALADSLTSHLRAVSHDKHLEVLFVPASPEVVPSAAEPPEEMLRRMADELRQERFGVESLDVLEGNVGLLDLRAFVAVDVPGAKEAVAAAMDSLSHTDALIIDLRRNQGGEAAMVQLLASYLFAPEPVQLSSIYWRPGNRTVEFWTHRELRGARYGRERPVYVLTSSRTFSAAEAFAYDLKALERATIVGETTAGGAHPGRLEPVSERFAVRLPTGRAINPVTGTNWEGTGVEPDVEADAGAALETAHLAALRSILTTPAGVRRRAELERLIQQMGGERPPGGT
jgi:C-terminal processing protease CtpA/Prc